MPVPVRNLAQTLRDQGAQERRRRNVPLWKGPLEDGVTQSLLGKYVVCGERFRISVIEGLDE